MFPRTERSQVPDAVAAVIAAVARENPNACPEALGRLAVRELRSLGWHIASGPLCTPESTNDAPAQPRTPAHARTPTRH